MFTIKLYTNEGRQKIIPADSFTILRAQGDASFEVTCHLRSDDACRCDIGPTGYNPEGGNWDWAYIENINGKTVERLAPRIFPELNLAEKAQMQVSA